MLGLGDFPLVIHFQERVLLHSLNSPWSFFPFFFFLCCCCGRWERPLKTKGDYSSQERGSRRIKSRFSVIFPVCICQFGLGTLMDVDYRVWKDSGLTLYFLPRSLWFWFPKSFCFFVSIVACVCVGVESSFSIQSL